ncbi:Protein NDRG3 [Armadillidium vulgare]|nr:Protein NDRG3 [Armadillidium vulgare]
MMKEFSYFSNEIENFPAEGLDDIELRNVQLSLASSKSLADDGSTGIKETVETRHGPITIAIAGDRSKPVILTFHDLGLNHITNFQNFMAYPDMKKLLSAFCIVHELAETITCVKSHVGFRSFIGFGVGLGANVLARYAIKYPAEVDALVLINCSVTQAGWIEWGYQKVNIRHLKAGRMTVGTVDFLMWHHFGKVENCNQDLVTVFKQYFDKSLNATNLGLLGDSYIRRTDLGIIREMDPNKKKDAKMIRCPILNITSNFSPHIEDTVTFNSRLDPSLSTWMKLLGDHDDLRLFPSEKLN